MDLSVSVVSESATLVGRRNRMLIVMRTLRTNHLHQLTLVVEVCQAVHVTFRPHIIERDYRAERL